MLEATARTPEVRVGNHLVPLDWMDGTNNETSKSWRERIDSGFFERYLSGEVVLDIGYRGSASGHAVPVLPHAIGIDEGYPDYNGIILPFEANSVDAVYSSHVLEHLQLYALNILEWYRVIKVGGYIVAMVPHKFLYERKDRPPSRWNMDHYRFYTPATLLATVEEVLAPNCYRVRHLADNDRDCNYADGPGRLPQGCYEIELVIQKIVHPGWYVPA